jgi:antitoxin CptB
MSGVAHAPVPGAMLWRCRRGMKELDLLLERFARGQLAAACAAERAEFEALLTLPDPELVAYLLGGVRPASPVREALVARIRAYVA